MINRKVLYGYQIQNGTLEIVPEEQRYRMHPMPQPRQECER